MLHNNNECFRGVALWRWVEDFGGIGKVFDLNPFQKFLYGLLIGRKIKANVLANGIGAHSKVEMHRLIQDDLRAVSGVLGPNRFIAGNHVSEEDCAVFGMLAQCLWALPGSPYETIMKSSGK